MPVNEATLQAVFAVARSVIAVPEAEFLTQTTNAELRASSTWSAKHFEHVFCAEQVWQARASATVPSAWQAK